VDETRILHLDGNKLAYTNDSPMAIHVPRAIPYRKSTFDGKKVMVYYRTARPNGEIRWDEKSPEGNKLSLRGVLPTLRPLDENTGGFNLAAFKPCPSIQVDGHMCMGLMAHVAGGANGLYRTVWLDPAMDYSVRRYVQSVGGKPVITLDITYDRDPKHGWIPKRWSSIWMNPETDTLVMAENAEVTSYEINVPIPADEFKIEFPPGTNVHDKTGGIE
jgi:hypothetical protein